MFIRNIATHTSKISRMATFILFVGLCLSLSAQKTKDLVILHTNDTHSRIMPFDESLNERDKAGKGGFERRAIFIEEERTLYPELLLLDCGDFSQGTPYYNLFNGEVEVRLMNAMHYDAVTIGNHEFDFGLENMKRLFEMATFEVVCANYDFSGTVLEGLVKPYTIFKRNGLKIGVFGLGTKLEGLVQEKNSTGVVYSDPYKTANEVAVHLKKKEKCDVVICLSHLGWKVSEKNYTSDEELIAKTRNIDLVLGGHSHSLFEKMLFYKNADGKEVPLQQMGKDGLYVGRVVMKFEKK